MTDRPENQEEAGPVVSGQCLCGKVGITVCGAPDFAIVCFCGDCQRISGGGHLPQAGFRAANVSTSGAISSYRWESDAGNQLELGFCGDCGSPLYKTTLKMPEVLFVAIGVLADQSQFHSPHLVFVEGCQAWDAFKDRVGA